MTSRISFFIPEAYPHLPPVAPGGGVIGGGGRESNPPDGDRPSHPL
jgi:hypothetical protein